MTPGLERMSVCLEAMGLRRLPGVAVQIAGTNGKGSAAAFLDSLARAHGLSTGLYTSPHFLTPRERIRVDGHMLAEEQWLELAETVWASGRAEPLTYFELLTAMAAAAFARRSVGLAVLETGLGGRFDAVTALDADLVLFSRIGVDHQAVLGRSLEEIAADKAGAMRPGGLAVSTEQRPEVWDILARRARETGTRLVPAASVVSWDPSTGAVRAATDAAILEAEGLRPGLAGPHQHANAQLALAGWLLVARSAGWPATPEACRRGLGRVHHPGRMQAVPFAAGRHPALILDGAHNEDGFLALTEAVRTMDRKPGCVVFNMLRDKPLDQVAPAVLALTEGPIYVPELTDNPRALPAWETAALLGSRARPADGVESALCAALEHPGPALVCGSLFLLAEFFRLRPDCLEPA